MAKTPGASCSVFVGNLPYDALEEELKDVFLKVGQVTSVRIVRDKDTKQPKGFCFVDFVDSSSVQGAIQQLNNVEYNGRKLRIDFAERELNAHDRGKEEDRLMVPRSGGPPPSRNAPGPPSRNAPPGPGGAPPPDALPPLVSPVQTAADRMARLKEQEEADATRASAQAAEGRAEIARILETMTPAQLFQIVGEMQRLAIRAPEVARALIAENLQLALALQHAQFLVGMIEEPPLPTKPEVRERARDVRQRVWQLPPPQQPMAAMQNPHGMPPPRMAAAAAPAYMVAAAAPAPPSIPGFPGGADQKGLMERLVNLSPAEIDQLDHGTKTQLLEFLQMMQQGPSK